MALNARSSLNFVRAKIHGSSKKGTTNNSLVSTQLERLQVLKYAQQDLGWIRYDYKFTP